MKLLLYPEVDSKRLNLIREAAGDMSVVNASNEQIALAEIAEADAFFGKITPEILAAASKLKWVQSPTASLEHYVFDELVNHPCKLSNMRGIFSDVIADHVMGCVVSLARNLHTYVRRQVEARWEPVGGNWSTSSITGGVHQVSAIDLEHRHLSDCVLGVVGVGNIGMEVCRRADAFGMTVIGVDPVCRDVPGISAQIWDTDQLPELLRRSDFVVIAAPHTPETYKLFRTPQFKQMQTSAYLINIGRGAIVDLADLTAALQDEEIAGAAGDFEVEPLPGDHPLWKMENVIITPHVAAASPRVSERHLETLLENIRRFARGEDPLTLVDKASWF